MGRRQPDQKRNTRGSRLLRLQWFGLPLSEDAASTVGQGCCIRLQGQGAAGAPGKAGRTARHRNFCRV